MGKCWLKQQNPTWWGSPTNSGRPGGWWGVRATQTYGHADRPLPRAGRGRGRCSAPQLAALAPSLSLLSHCGLQSSGGAGGGDELFLMTISPSFFFFPRHSLQFLEAACWCWGHSHGTGAEGTTATLFGPLVHWWGHPQIAVLCPVVLWQCPLQLGALGAMLCAPIPAVPRHPWGSGDHGRWGLRAVEAPACSGRPLGEGFAPPVTPPPRPPASWWGVNRAGNVLPRLLGNGLQVGKPAGSAPGATGTSPLHPSRVTATAQP